MTPRTIPVKRKHNSSTATNLQTRNAKVHDHIHKINVDGYNEQINPVHSFCFFKIILVVTSDLCKHSEFPAKMATCGTVYCWGT